MKWSAIDARDGWRRRFAFLPVKIDGEWIWLEWFERRRLSRRLYLVRRLGDFDAAL